MYGLLIIGSAALTVKAYYAAQGSNFILFLIFIFIANIFTLVARKERR